MEKYLLEDTIILSALRISRLPNAWTVNGIIHHGMLSSYHLWGMATKCKNAVYLQAATCGQVLQGRNDCTSSRYPM
jgi:hypothetical protein